MGHRPHFLIYMESLSVTESIKEIIKTLLQEVDTELVDILYRREQRGMVLRILVDKQGGITLDECALLNEKISALLDAENTIGESYILEVSSPGIDRPFVTKRDFERAKGNLVRIILNKPFLEKFEHVGILEEILGDGIRINTQKRGILEIHFEDIKRARQEIKF